MGGILGASQNRRHRGQVRSERGLAMEGTHQDRQQMGIMEAVPTRRPFEAVRFYEGLGARSRVLEPGAAVVTATSARIAGRGRAGEGAGMPNVDDRSGQDAKGTADFRSRTPSRLDSIARRRPCRKRRPRASASRIPHRRSCSRAAGAPAGDVSLRQHARLETEVAMKLRALQVSCRLFAARSGGVGVVDVQDACWNWRAPSNPGPERLLEPDSFK